MDNSADRQAWKVLSPEDLEDIRDHVVSRTSRGVGRDDILLAICETYELFWPQAEDLVDGILTESSEEVSFRRDTLSGMIAIFVSLLTFLAGCALAVVTGHEIVSRLSQHSFDHSSWIGDLIMLWDADNRLPIAGLPVSAILIVVGLRGLWRSAGDFFLTLLESDSGS